MNKLTLDETLIMLKSKKGAGKAKKTRVRIDMDIEFSSGILGTQGFIERFQAFMQAIIGHQSEYAGFSIKDPKVIDNTFVETELEDNPKNDYI